MPVADNATVIVDRPKAEEPKAQWGFKDLKVVNVVKVLNILNVIKDNKSPAQAGI